MIRKDFEFEGIIDDTSAVFDNAEPHIDNVKSEYMYMYSSDNFDFFKHIDTRQYKLAPRAKV
tara:strand:- start:278 stop:463 length:186 start_codon:yes stop_codon:yes gene_type:complete